MCEQEHGTQTALVQWVLHSRMRAGVRTSIRAQHVGSAQRDARPSVPAKDVEPQQSHVQAHASKHTDAQPFHALAASPTDPALATGPRQQPGDSSVPITRPRLLQVLEEALPGRSAPARRASACQAPLGSAPAMPAVPGLCSSPSASSPGGSARLTAWRLFIRRQRQQELLADAGAFVLQGSLLPASRVPPVSLSASVPRRRVPVHGDDAGCPGVPTVPPAHPATKPLNPPARGYHGAPQLLCSVGGEPQHHPLLTAMRAQGLAQRRGWKWQPKGIGAGCRRLCSKRPGGHPGLQPPQPLPGAALAAGAGMGTSPGGRCPQAPRGREQSPGISFLAGPTTPPPCPHPPPALGRGDTIKSVFC